MTITGLGKQEEKLSELAAVAKAMFPEANELAIKGVLRKGVKAALEKIGATDWKDIVDQPSVIRKNFFNTMLQESKPSLGALVGAGNIDQLIVRMQQANQKYLNV